MRIVPAIALAATLMTGACTYPDGSFNAPGTIALGAGAALAGVAIAAAADDGPRYHRPSYGYGRPSYGYGRPHYGRGYGYGYGPRYRRW